MLFVKRASPQSTTQHATVDTTLVPGAAKLRLQAHGPDRAWPWPIQTCCVVSAHTNIQGLRLQHARPANGLVAATQQTPSCGPAYTKRLWTVTLLQESPQLTIALHVARMLQSHVKTLPASCLGGQTAAHAHTRCSHKQPFWAKAAAVCTHATLYYGQNMTTHWLCGVKTLQVRSTSSMCVSATSTAPRLTLLAACSRPQAFRNLCDKGVEVVPRRGANCFTSNAEKRGGGDNVDHRRDAI